MRGLFYLLEKTTKNKIKKALRKPWTYFWVVFAIAYIVMVVGSFQPLITQFNLGNPEGFTLAVSLSVFFLLPTNIITYAKRKGLIFKQSEVHFVFPSPVNPKAVLIYAKTKQILLSLLINLVIVWAGVVYFKLSILQIVLYFVLAFIVETILETSITILLYGNETLSEKKILLFCRSLYLIIGALLVFGAYLFFTYEASWKIIGMFLTHPVVQCVPVIGWNIAFLRLIMLGPTTLNVICTVLYLMSAIILFIMAYKMKCQGAYYEEAMKFADDYAVKMAKNKKGEMSVRFKKINKNATVVYKGNYAKAIFYRQLLEYKKNRFFIFGLTSVINLIAGIAIGVFGYYNYEEIGAFSVFIIPGISAYITFIFSGYVTKWSKEIAHPYTFLIPDTAARKLWYATVIEHIRAAVDGILITLPAAVTLHLNPIEILLTVLVYVCLQANKLYLNVLTDAIMQKFLGNVGKQLFRVFTIGIIISICAVSAIFGGLFLSAAAGYMIMIGISLAITAVLVLLASKAFENMESID
ncbi:putative ABC exporter domain-containing protein [Konateibacter massiliensis]|uniref:putative ABC exporter domain-containing protein n=1 Tax=Konateibacter massiliensis TaxID=2002841 RepID=UPI000C153BFC|nr:putative ABC exporter domain-containing protein [Konateibacter massiliensis]